MIRGKRDVGCIGFFVPCGLGRHKIKFTGAITISSAISIFIETLEIFVIDRLPLNNANFSVMKYGNILKMFGEKILLVIKLR